MISRIEGKLVEANFTTALIDVNGLGYSVFIPMSTFDKLPSPGQKVTLQTHLHVREDAMTLFGFSEKNELQIFQILISVNGVGPKMALNILSTMPVSSFCSAIINNDLNVIKKINGVGKKTAERLIIELKDKIAKFSPETNLDTTTIPQKHSQNIEDAVLALEQLGFKRPQIQKAINKETKNLTDDEMSSSNLIRICLRALNS